MLQFSNLSRERVMETETISKNEAGLKSQTSRGNFLIMLLSIFFIGFIFSGCKKDDPIVIDEGTYKPPANLTQEEILTLLDNAENMWLNERKNMMTIHFCKLSTHTLLMTWQSWSFSSFGRQTT